MVINVLYSSFSSAARNNLTKYSLIKVSELHSCINHDWALSILLVRIVQNPENRPSLEEKPQLHHYFIFLISATTVADVSYPFLFSTTN